MVQITESAKTKLAEVMKGYPGKTVRVIIRGLG